MRESSQALALLRQRISSMEAARPREASPILVSLGHAGIDAALEGGLACGRLHEIFAEQADDASSAAGFAAMLMRRLGPGAPHVWLRLDAAQKTGGSLHAAGLAELGGDPGNLVLGILPDSLSLLRIAAEMLRCGDIGTVVAELWRTPRELDLTATRRLAVAAEASGGTALLLRVDAQPMPSAADTRWSIRSSAATPLAANAPGLATLDVELLRRRGRGVGAQNHWRVVWDHEYAIFHDIASTTHDAGENRAAG